MPPYPDVDYALHVYQIRVGPHVRSGAPLVEAVEKETSGLPQAILGSYPMPRIASVTKRERASLLGGLGSK